MKKLNGYWLFRVIVKILIPVMFFVIANVEWTDLANGLAGIMVILVLFYYVAILNTVGDEKWDYRK